MDLQKYCNDDGALYVNKDEEGLQNIYKREGHL